MFGENWVLRRLTPDLAELAEAEACIELADDLIEDLIEDEAAEDAEVEVFLNRTPETRTSPPTISKSEEVESQKRHGLTGVDLKRGFEGGWVEAWSELELELELEYGSDSGKKMLKMLDFIIIYSVFLFVCVCVFLK